MVLCLKRKIYSKNRRMSDLTFHLALRGEPLGSPTYLISLLTAPWQIVFTKQSVMLSPNPDDDSLKVQYLYDIPVDSISNTILNIISYFPIYVYIMIYPGHYRHFLYCLLVKSIFYFFLNFMFYQLLRVQLHSCSSTQSWGSVLPSIVETRDQNSWGCPLLFSNRNLGSFCA